ncbi:MAG: hypothetical protein K6T91_01100 [Firmicutes bacterium]|nr:hypothetical protein [Bacillota bacterium]
MDSKKYLPIIVIAVAIILLIPIAYYAIWSPQATQSGYTGQTGANNQQLPRTGTGSTGGTTNVAPQPTAPVSSKDPATIVPDGMALDQYCEKYYSAWKNKDWQTAYDLQPLSKKNQSDVNSFAQSRESYGMQSYEVGKPQINENSGIVVVKMDLGQNGIWSATWQFVKNDKGQWTVQNSTTQPSQ